MLRHLVFASLQHRGVVVALTALAIGYGVAQALKAKLDVFPEFAPPLVIVHTEAPGLSPEEVEVLVTRPVENGINGAGAIQAIRSQSIQGLSVVTAVFQDGTDVLAARQRVSERLVRIAEDLPSGVRAPVLTPLTSSTSLVLALGLTAEKRTAMDLRSIADWTLRPVLLAVPGVASVVEFGGEVRQLQVQLRQDMLLAHGVAPADVVEAARQATGLVGAGFIETENQRIAIRTEGQSLTSQRLGECLVAPGIRLKDVAHVVAASAPKIGDGAINGKPGVLLLVWSQYGQNTLDVTEDVEQALETIRPTLAAEGVELHGDLFRPASFVQASIRNLTLSMLIGGALVAAVLGIFLLDARTAFISILAIPLSLLTAVTVLEAWGATLNTLTLGGLAIAIGEVVDDAIIDVENILRRLRENRERGSPRSAFDVVLGASLEVRSAVVHATFIVALVFLPVISMSGIQGKLFAPLGIAYILAVIASLVVALTVTPALSLLLLARAGPGPEPRYLQWAKRAHSRLLAASSRHQGVVIAVAGAVCAAAACAIPFLGGEFLPELREGHYIVQMSMVPCTSSLASMRLGCQVSRELLANPRIRSVSLQVGRAELGEDTAGTDFSELIVALQPAAEEEEAEAARAEIRRSLAAVPGAKFAVKPFLEERIEETISGARAVVTIRVYGNDLDVLDEKAADVERALLTVPGSVDVRFQRSSEPRLTVRLRPERLGYLGFRPLEVMTAIQTATQGRVAAQVFDGNQVVDVVVLLEEAARREPESVGTLMVRSATGVQVPVRKLADVFLTSGRHTVLHDGLLRYQEVSCNVEGRDLESFVADAKAAIAAMVDLPAGCRLTFGGAAEATAQARREILLYSLVAAAGIALLLGLAFKNPTNFLLALANLPFALVGGVIGVLVTGGTLSLGSLVGFVTLFGITTRNSIMLLSHFEHLVAAEGLAWGPATALRGASERFVPVLMTATVTGLGLLPLAVGSESAGREVEGPMAIVILGGLVTSTALNLLVLPSLALRYGRFQASQPSAQEASS